MSTFERTTLEATTIAATRRECAMQPQEISAAIGDGFGVLMPALGAAGVAPLGPPMVAYVKIEAGRMEFDVARMIAPADADKLKDAAGVTIATTIEGPAIKTVHKGPYNGLGDTYQKMFAFMREEGLEPGPACYELYLNDPGDTPPADLLTEIRQPLK